LNQIDSSRVDFFELEPELPEILDGAWIYWVWLHHWVKVGLWTRPAILV
jgi:hypothetical protein